jgi:phage protein D
MALGFQIEVGGYKWTAESEVVETVEFDSSKSPKAVTMVDVTVADPKANGRYFPIFNSLPDPRVETIPFKLYLKAADQSKPYLVFEGKVGSLQPGYPDPSKTSIVAYDYSIGTRIQSRYRTYANLKSTDITKRILQDYGFSTDLAPDVKAFQRRVDIGMGLSDWDHLARALAADGLELYVSGTTFKVRKNASQEYAITFSPDDGNVEKFEARINHVGPPGTGGQSKAPLPGGNSGSMNSITGSAAAIAESTQDTTHRRPIAGAAKDHEGAHTESVTSLSPSGTKKKDRQDEVTLTLKLMPDIMISHKIKLSGWGKKIDGSWHLSRVHHSIAGHESTTTLHLTNAPTSSSDASKSGAVLPGGNT